MMHEHPPATDSELELLLREERNGPPLPGEVTPWDFVGRWPDSIVRGRVWPIIRGFLVDADDVVRARAIEFIRVWDAGRQLTTSVLLEAEAQHAELFGDQVVEGISLRDRMGHALSNLAYEVGERVAVLLRDMCRDQPVIGAGSVLGRFFPEFAVSKISVWGDRGDRFFVDAAGSIALYRRDMVVPYLDAARPLSAALRREILDRVEQYIKRDDAAAAQMAKGEGFPPPAKPAPTAEYCRRAIGL